MRPWLVLAGAALLLALSGSARQEHYERESFTLSDEAIQQLVELDPPPWQSVHEGHLGKLLIPRACKSAYPNGKASG